MKRTRYGRKQTRGRRARKLNANRKLKPRATLNDATKKNRSLFFIVISAIGVVIALMANLDGARNFVCGIHSIPMLCTPQPPSQETISLNENDGQLLNMINGTWGLQAADNKKSCRETVIYSVQKREGEDYILLNGKDWSSEGIVVSIGPASVFTRTTKPVEMAGSQWEMSPFKDILSVIDNNGVVSNLVRCG